MYPGFESIKYFYDINCYTDEDIQTYVELEAIDKEQYEEITGEEYSESQAEQLVAFIIESGRFNVE